MTSDRSSLLDHLVSVLIRFRYVLLPVVLVLLGLAWPISQQLQFDQSIESLYSEDDVHLRDYRRSKHLFGGDEFVMVAYDEPELFTEDGVKLTPKSAQRIKEFSDRLGEIPGVDGESIQNLASALHFPYRRRTVRKLATGLLVGENGRTTSIILRLVAEDKASVSRAETFRSIRKLASDHNPPAFVAGEPVQVHDMFRLVEQDGRVLFWWSLGLLSLVIVILFRSVRWVVLPLMVVVVTIVWTEATLVLSQMELSMVSSMLNAMVTIIGVATVTHVTVHYRDLRRELERTEAVHQTFVELIPAVFWTATTTAVGFAALLSSHITPIRSFGIMMALASMLVLTSLVGILPGGILLGRHSFDPGHAPAENLLARFLSRISGWIEHHPRILGLLFLVSMIATGIGFTRLKVETDFSKNFRESSDIVRSLNFVETNLGGAGSWEINFPAPEQLTDEYLDRVRDVSVKLREFTIDGKHPLTKVVSLTDSLDLIPKRILFARLSIDRRLSILDGTQKDLVATMYNPGQRRMRIVLRALERQPSERKTLAIKGAVEIVRSAFPESDSSEHPRPIATGLYVLLTFLIQSLLGDQLVSFAWAAAGIGLMMTIAFRSLKIGLISLVPNAFPIVLVIGSMGWSGVPINIATAMIASVSMGLTVDSTIHYLAAYRRARGRGLSLHEALHETHQGVGRALVFANLSLIVGFMVLTLSHFIPLVYFGVLLSVAMVGGLIGDLVLLPLMLGWFDAGPVSGSIAKTAPISEADVE